MPLLTVEEADTVEELESHGYEFEFDTGSYNLAGKNSDGFLAYVSREDETPYFSINSPLLGDASTERDVVRQFPSQERYQQATEIVERPEIEQFGEIGTVGLKASMTGDSEVDDLSELVEPVDSAVRTFWDIFQAVE